MGWDVSLMYKDETCTVVDGKALGSTLKFSDPEFTKPIVHECDALITYNYTEIYCAILGNNLYDFLDGKQARHTIEMLEKGVDKLGIVQFENYYAPTMGNAGYVCSVLLQWAKQNPNGIWGISR